MVTKGRGPKKCPRCIELRKALGGDKPLTHEETVKQIAYLRDSQLASSELLAEASVLLTESLTELSQLKDLEVRPRCERCGNLCEFQRDVLCEFCRRMVTKGI